MTDLSQLIADLCAGLEDVETPSFSGFPETVSGEANPQLIDITGSFRSFQSFQSENDTPGSNGTSRSENVEFLADAHARASSCGLNPERPERPEITGYPPLAEGVPPFPVRDSEPERPEREVAVAGVFPSPSDSLPISPADVRTAVARELRHLATLGMTGPEAEARAVAITRAKVGNSSALVVRQTNTGRCAVCDQPLREADAAIAVLNAGGQPLHIHADCHGAHRARRQALVDAIMRSAGYGAEVEGDAA